jgi:hypothetical protein
MSKETNIWYEIGMLGQIVAAVISWSVNKSILWCILHAMFGWFYVIYYALGYGR